VLLGGASSGGPVTGWVRIVKFRGVWRPECNQVREDVDAESEDRAMKLFKRHIGRRVAGIGVAAALLVLGLEAPAFATAPTITSFTPTSGPDGTCVVTITGTNFDNPAPTLASDVKFNTTNAANYTVVSATQIRAEVAAGTTTGPIHVHNADGTADSSTSFTVADPGGCAPTITSFTPTCGPAGTSVTITGTNLLDASDSPGTVKFFNNKTATSTLVLSATQITAAVPSGATTGKISVDTGVGSAATSTADFTVAAACATITSFTPTFGPVGTVVKITGTGFTGATAVSFNNVAATTFHVDSATQITATVPTGATTGKIRVTVGGGTVASAADFVVSVVHARSITLKLVKHLVAKGKVSVGDGFTACAASVPVKIQRRVSGNWKNVASTTTSATGAYKRKIKDKPGKYRAKAPKVVQGGGANICKGDTSPVKKNT
jgi:IPT/TIG domain